MVNIKKSEINPAYVKVCTTVLNGIKDYFSEKMKRDISKSDVISILNEIYCSDSTDDDQSQNHYKKQRNDGKLYIS